MSKINCPSKYNLFQLTLFLKLHLYSSLSENHFGVCVPKKCGDVDISYPFHITNQQEKYCGYPGFEVSCKNGDLPYLNVSEDSYLIKHISYESQTFQVINSVFVDYVGRGSGGGGGRRPNCFSLPQNLTFNNDVFRFASKHQDISLLLNCSPSVLQEYKEDSVICGTLALYGDDSKLRDLEGKCNGVISVPYEGETKIGSNLTAVLEDGFSLKWTANNCSACIKSGGQCGFDGSINEFSCFCPDRTHAYHCATEIHKKPSLPLILGIGIGAGILLLIVLVAIWYRKKLKFGHSKFVSQSGSLDRSGSDFERGSIYFGIPLFSYSELEEATDHFDQSKELGDGGFGTVYYGKLRDGREVAVKRLYEKNYKRVEQFMNEVQILTCLRHHNLVSLYGCTSRHSKELLLVYEFVPNGTVADHLYGDKAKPGSLPWPIRLRIAIETASALSYLHASDIIHRDVKTYNILLDSSFSVKVADFGLSRLFPIHVTHVSTAPQGTPGYLDPEYHQCYQLTDKSDVYSFGVVLVELISSLPAVDMNRHRHEINLSTYAMNRIQRCAFDELVDSELGYASDFKVRRMTTAVGELAFQCLQHDKDFRPSMDEVFEVLKRIESADYEALLAEEMGKKNAVSKSANPPLSPIQDDHAKLLSNHKLFPPSPSSVMDTWGSKSTTPSTSK